MTFLKIIKDNILNLLFPVECINCQAKNQIICESCLLKIKLHDKEIKDDITAIFNYRDPIVKKIIWELKYHNKRYLGNTLGRILYETMQEEIADMRIFASGKPIYVIPVPLSKKRRRYRGYNQSLLIAKGFCKMSDKNIFEIKNNIVFKKIETPPQASINDKKKRLKNILGVFDIKNKELIKNRNIIIIDDVTTTGGTMKEIMRVLKKAGAKKVTGFAIAH